MSCRVSSDHGEERESVVRMDAARVDLIEGSNGGPSRTFVLHVFISISPILTSCG
jgi:hypothetical protein